MQYFNVYDVSVWFISVSYQRGINSVKVLNEIVAVKCFKQLMPVISLFSLLDA